MSHVSECIDLYAYDCEVSDYWFSRMLHEAIEKDAAEGHATGAARQIRVLREKFSVHVDNYYALPGIPRLP